MAPICSGRASHVRYGQEPRARSPLRAVQLTRARDTVKDGLIAILAPPDPARRRPKARHVLSWPAAALPLHPRPAVQAQALLRQVARLVAHLLRALDPIAEIDMGQAEAARLLDMVENDKT